MSNERSNEKSHEGRGGIGEMVERLKEYYEGDPWYGRNVKEQLGEVSEEKAYRQPEGGHSPLQLLWHMITWREFVVSRLAPEEGEALSYFEEMNWRELDHTDRTLWPRGLERIEELQRQLVELIGKQDDRILEQVVPGRSYTFRTLLEGIAVHDVYHLGQIVILNKSEWRNSVEKEGGERR